MKIQCDVCNKNDASVFCTADEAALCDACDQRVHHANKLASKHRRFSLFHPSSKQFPVCDVCQEKRAFMFCHEDRAILCRECDIPIHTANEHTQKHNRFLLTGVKLSPTSTPYASSLSNGGCDSSKTRDLDANHHKSIKNHIPVSVAPLNSNPSSKSKIPTNNNNNSSTCGMLTTDNSNCNGGKLNSTSVVAAANETCVSTTTSSISEYLEMVPGWHVEDLLDSSSDPFGFCKGNDGILPFLDADLDCNWSSLSSERMGIWVPQAPTSAVETSQIGGHVSFKAQETKDAVTNMKADETTRYPEDCFIVPQISPQTAGFKRLGLISGRGSTAYA